MWPDENFQGLQTDKSSTPLVLLHTHWLVGHIVDHHRRVAFMPSHSWILNADYYRFSLDTTVPLLLLGHKMHLLESWQWSQSSLPLPSSGSNQQSEIIATWPVHSSSKSYLRRGIWLIIDPYVILILHTLNSTKKQIKKITHLTLPTSNNWLKPVGMQYFDRPHVTHLGIPKPDFMIMHSGRHNTKEPRPSP